ncbi:MAG: HigA family addiction module antitoxin [Hyphomonadaceae bacterium]
MAKAKIKVGMKPAHPGAFIQGEILDFHDLSVVQAAGILGVRRATLSDLLNEKSSLSADMAMRIELAFGVEAELLLRIQALWDANDIHQKADAFDVKPYKPRAA